MLADSNKYFCGGIMEGDIERIKQIIDEVKPQYTMFGGDVEFMDVKDGRVRVRPVGYCYR